MASSRTCAWCGGDIPPAARVDAVTCSKRCRQARHRFNAAVGQGVAPSSSNPMRLAYADPPYPGLSKRYYGDHPDYDGEVDHAALIASLSGYDGWALSTSAKSLQFVLSLCPPGVRVASWHRGERPTQSGRPLNAWEPVIYFGGRVLSHHGATRPVAADVEHDVSPEYSRDTSHGSERRFIDLLPEASPLAAALRDASQPGQPDTSPVDARRLDTLEYVARARTTDPNRVVGAKPAAFCRWIFDLLGAQIGDDFTDLFPGSGGVARAWATFTGDTSSQPNAVSGSVPHSWSVNAPHGQ